MSSKLHSTIRNIGARALGLLNHGLGTAEAQDMAWGGDMTMETQKTSCHWCDSQPDSTVSLFYERVSWNLSGERNRSLEILA